MTAHPELPAIIAEIAEVAGADAAWELAREKGGLTIFIPAHARSGHWLVKLLGQEAADKICAHYRHLSPEGRFNGGMLLIPMAASAQAARRWHDVLRSGLSATGQAKAMGVHERTVWRRRARHRSDDDSPQGNLF
jgi:hypothetical protein